MDTKVLKEVQRKTFRNREFFFRVFLGICIFSFAALAFLSKANNYFSSDLIISRFIQTINIWGFGELMMFLSVIGDPPFSILLVSVFGILFFIKNKRLDAAAILFSSFVGIALSQMFKALVDRPRPDGELVLRLVTETSGSFPSGHVLFFISLFGVLLYLTYSKLKTSIIRSSLIGALAAGILLIGVSRIYLGVHWFSDVLGSYLIGTIWLYIVITLYNKFKV